MGKALPAFVGSLVKRVRVHRRSGRALARIGGDQPGASVPGGGPPSSLTALELMAPLAESRDGVAGKRLGR